MMEYPMFKAMVEERLSDYLPEEYKGSKVIIKSVNKVNQTLDMLFIEDLSGGVKINPAIYINDMYQDYVYSKDFDETIKTAVEDYINTIRTKDEINCEKLFDIGEVKDNIIFQLINAEQNKEMLAAMPHRDLCDLSVIYRIVDKIDKDGFYSIPINNNYADTLGLSEEQLYDCAFINTKKLLPPVVMSIQDLLQKCFNTGDMPNDIADIIISDLPEDLKMYAITNNKGINGAAGMLYDDELKKLADKFGTDLYILPSSIHEVIVISTDMGTPDKLAEMVREININAVELSSRLSNQVYHYDKELHKITLASDTPYKQLDGETGREDKINLTDVSVTYEKSNFR